MKDTNENNEIENKELDNDSIVVDNNQHVEEVILTEDVEDTILEDEVSDEIETPPTVVPPQSPELEKEIEKEIEKTQVPPAEEKDGKRNWLIAIGIALVILLLIYILNNNNKVDKEDIEPVNTDEIVEITESEPIESEVIITEESEEDEVVEETEEEVEEATSSMAETMTDAAWSNVDLALREIDEYVNNPTITNRLVSNGGILYNVNTNEIVEYDRIFDEVNYPNINLEYGEILYIYSDDLKDYPQLRISDNKEMEIFYAYETEEGVAISSLKSGGGILTKDEYEELMGRYTRRQGGKIRKPGRDDADYLELNFMAYMAITDENTSDDENLATRFLQYDDDYAIVVTSLNSKPKEIHSFVFERLYDQWFLAKQDFHEEEYYYKALNKEFPLLNMQLLPTYDIDQYEDYDFIAGPALDPIVDGILATGQITEENLPLIYGVGVGKCYYLEFNNGKYFVGVADDDNSITTYPVATSMDIQAVLDTHVTRPPYIIFKQY